jgi:hypothetical protein
VSAVGSRPSFVRQWGGAGIVSCGFARRGAARHGLADTGRGGRSMSAMVHASALWILLSPLLLQQGRHRRDEGRQHTPEVTAARRRHTSVSSRVALLGMLYRVWGGIAHRCICGLLGNIMP